MAGSLLFKGLSLGNGAGGGLLRLFEFQDTFDISAAVSPGAWLYPWENKDEMNSYLGFTQGNALNTTACALFYPGVSYSSCAPVAPASTELSEGAAGLNPVFTNPCSMNQCPPKHT